MYNVGNMEESVPVCVVSEPDPPPPPRARVWLRDYSNNTGLCRREMRLGLHLVVPRSLLPSYPSKSKNGAW